MKFKNIFIVLMVLLSLSGIAYATGTISGVTNLLFSDSTKITLETPKVNISTYDASLKLYANEHNIFGQENGEAIELRAVKNDSKAYIGWYAYEPFTNSIRGVAWMGAHYDSDPVTSPPHQHFSIETLDNSTGTPLIHTKFQISYTATDTHADVSFPNSALWVPGINADISGIRFWGDETTRIWQNAYNEIRFTTGGSTRLTITNGTSEFTNRLITATGGNGGYSFNTGGTDKIWANAAADIRISTGGSSRVAITNASTQILNTLQLSTTKPSSSLAVGMMFYNTTSNTTNCYDGSAWRYCGNGTLV